MITLRAAINDKCRECVFDRHGPDPWRQQAEAYTAISCPLYSVRPTALTSRRPKSLDALKNRKLGQIGTVSSNG